MPATDSVRAIGRDVELAVICVPAESVLAAAEDVLQSGVRALCVISAGFAEVGADGAERQERLLALVRSYGGRMIGPNCLGVASTPARLNATFAAAALPPGTVGFASQSGALGLAAVEQARGRGLGLSSFVSLGNKADVSSNDLLEYWEDDRGHERRRPLPRELRQSRAIRADRAPRRAPQARARAQGRCQCGGRAGRGLAHGRARELRGCGRRPLPPGRRTEDAHALGAARRGGSALVPAAPSRSPRRRADQCGRPRNPLRRRLRSRGPAIARAFGRDARAARRRRPSRGEPRQPHRPARLRHGRDVRGRARPRCSRIPASTPSACSSYGRRSRVPRTSRATWTSRSPQPADTARPW